jgi:YHS domain-containing protein
MEYGIGQSMNMKKIKTMVAAALLAGFATSSFTSLADDAAKPDPKLKPYPLKTCVVSGEKLGSMDDIYVYKYKDREIKFCCKDCLKDFNKNPAKYVKKLEEAEAKASASK